MKTLVGALVGILFVTACSSGSGGGGGFGGTAGTGGGTAGTGGGTAGTGGGTAGTGGGSSFPTMHCEVDPDSCICIKAGGGNEPTPGVECAPGIVPNAVCCTRLGYPETGTCTCTQWGCSTGSISCTCGLFITGDQASCDSSFRHCCVRTSQLSQPTSCSCSDFECRDDETEVTSCGIDMAGCANGDLRIDRCTPEPK